MSASDFGANIGEVDLRQLGINMKVDPTMGDRIEGDIAMENIKKFVEDSNKLGRNAIRQSYRYVKVNDSPTQFFPYSDISLSV